MAVKMEGASPPVFEQIFRNARFAQGGNALFEGKVAGSPRPQVVWTRKGLQMQGSDKHQMMYDEASGKVSLLIKAIGPGDEGEYTCTALNPYGEAICTVYISPEATKAVKKSRSSHKISKSKSGHDQQMMQQQQEQQQQLQTQQLQSQQSMQKSVQQSSSSSIQQSSAQSSSMVQQASSSNFSQSSSSFEQKSSMQQSSSSAFQMSSGFQQSSSVQQSSVQQSSIQQSSMQQSSVQQSSVQSFGNQQAQLKEAEPEVIYLKHVERQAQQQRKEENVTKYSAPAFMTPLKDVTVTEGERSHFEAKVGPVGDPSMTVEWFVNGNQITASSRINTACQFGFVSMDMLNTTASDMGEYTCVVKSDSGSVNCSCRLMVQQRREIESEMHSSNLKMVQEQQVQQTVVQEEVVPAPKFQRPLQNMGERMEGSSIKLEAQVTPSSDSSMKIEWFKDGQPITASSRIGTIFSFGYVSLNISDLRAEDAGTYTCRAVNKSGEDRTQASFNVKASMAMTASTGLEEQQAYIQKTEQLEMYQASKMTKSEMTIEQPNAAPEFKTNIKDQAEVKEGGFAHFEARLEPMGDHTMNVQWLKDGQPVEASSRITSFFNFGYVALTVKQVALHDQGTYACVATNAQGRAETRAQLRCNGKADAEFQSKSWESVQQMESRKVETRTEIQQEITSAPRFVSALKGTNVVLEGQKAHFECRVEPQNDPKMSCQWYFNGQALSASSRIQTFHDFGYVAIDINDAKKEDSGTYTLVATNVLGTQKAEVQLNVNAHAQVDYSSMHSRTVEETKRFEMKQEVKQEFEEVAPTGPPVFKLTLVSPDPVSDGKNIHLEARLEPIGDPSMKVEWFFNGRPLTIGSRFKTYNDFGFIALDILGVTSLDAGQYVCRASNKLGEASTQAEVRVLAKSNIVTETEHESAMQQISYLESEKVKKTEEEETAKVAPAFTKPLKNVESMEGQNIHLEARLSPTGDTTMKVEWTFNGKPLPHGHRFRPAYDFDYVALDLLSVYPEDSGVYTCHARNAYGEAVSSATIKIAGQAQVVAESRTEMRQFASLETKTSTRTEVEETTAQAPVFTSTPKSVDVREGQKAHFEARIIPVSDPTLKIEWFFNGQPIKQGSRFREGHDFGFVSLDISQVLPEDAGQYSCRATNTMGQAVCNANLTCKATGSLVKETIHESALQQINYLESKSAGKSEEEGFTSQAPQFTASIRDQKVIEGAPAHFEAKLVPIGDPKLRVEWLKDGKSISASNRMSTLHDFGFVALDLKYTRPDDAGKYSIRAYNGLGDTTISATLQVLSAQGGADMETMHGEALEKIAYLERHKAKHDMDSDEHAQIKPNFSAQLQGKTQLLEGQSAHLECRIDPYPDSTLKVEWFHNGKPLPFGNRWRTSYDFGFAALDIIGAYAEDSGKYTIKATNILGSAESSVNVVVSSGKGLLLDSDHQEALSKIKYLESKHQKTAEEELVAPEAPQFGRPLKNMVLDEGQPAHFETTLTPVNDASMRVEWLFNGKSVPQGHRFRTTYDFGFVALDILYAYPEDSGTYTCVAKNVLGETKSQCTLQVQGKAGLLLDTMDKDRLGQLRNLEQRERVRPNEVEAEVCKPVFTTPLNNVEGAMEGAHIHLECRLEPINDPNLKVEWFVNNKAIKYGSRFRTTHDFGFVALDVLQSYAEDSGTYMCRATNKMGEAVNSSSVSIIARKGLLLDSQHPEGWEKMQGMEKRQRYQTLDVEETIITAPKFVTQLQGKTSLSEGQSAHFEAQVEPIHDSSLKIEFLHNGRAIQQASRIHTVCDFGYVALDIGQLISQDAGEYVCIAKNALGECRSSITLDISSHGSLDTSSQRPESQDKIRELEARGQRPHSDDVQTFQKPVFTTALQNVESGESSSAHLAARLIPVGDPSLRVEWLKDGNVLETGSRINVVDDFGLVSLDIRGLRESDSGIYECRAINKIGEAVTTASVKVHGKDSLLLDSQHPEGLKKINALESRVPRQVSEVEASYGKPVFTSPLTGTKEVAEGKAAHLECRVVPVGDPNMTYEWSRNGETVTMGSRMKATQDFGFVTLDILQCIPEDSGMYMIKAKNFSGESSSSFAVHVGGKGGILSDSMHPESFKKLTELEEGKGRQAKDEVDAGPNQPPVFMEQLNKVGEVGEGQSIHLDAKLEPKNDPNLRVEWEVNGKVLTTGSRIKTSLDFGLVKLDIDSIRASDVGIYTCKAVNLNGEATSTTSIKVQDERAAGIEGAKEVGPPKFVTQLVSRIEVSEGQSAHFEARLTPTEDPNMKIEWFKDGKPLSVGNRWRTFHDFGIVILDILYCYASDSGSYECRATNKLGKDSTSGSVACSEKSGLILTPQVPGEMREQTLQQIQHLESHKTMTSQTSVSSSTTAPRFTTPISNIAGLKEGENAHFEARLLPTDDANMSIEWFWNGKALKAGSRIRTFCDFGFVILEISPVYPEDAGEYTCRAKNALGEAVTTATLTCSGKRNIILDSQLPSGMEGAMDRIAALEGLGRARAEQQTEEDLNQPPEFLSSLEDLLLGENALAHFETRLTPINDPSMKVEWFHNGKNLSAGSRIKTINDFGFVILEVANVMARDSGNYTCKAVNRHGETSVSCQVQVKGRQGIETQPQLPKSFQTGTDSIHNLEERMWKREDVTQEEFVSKAPMFVTQPRDQTCYEGQAAHFDCRIEPIGDGSMSVEWYQDGRPIQIGSRVHTINDFGFVVLDVDWTFKRDSGVYKCIAKNKCGTAEVTANLNVKSKKDIVIDSQLPQGMSMERLKELEAKKAEAAAEADSEVTIPKFITQIQSRAVAEGEPAHFECRVDPKNDPKLQIKWYHNGKEVDFGHRFRLTFEFGYVALDILYTYPEDEGEYVCKAFNELGEDITRAELRCKELPAIQLENQVPKGMKKSEYLVQMEATMRKYTTEMFLTEDDVYDSERRQPPRFVTQIQSITSLEEMQATKFECQLAPVGDPNMKVEWFYNGKPLSFKTRFTPIYDFGYVAMNFGWVYPEDSGEYICRATNQYGSDETRAIIKCSGKTGIVYESQLPKGMQSIDRIREMESGWQRAPELLETETEKFKPCFVTKPEAVTTSEGGSARFCCRVTGYPKPRVMWLINGHTVINGSRHKLIYDGMWHLDIPKCQDRDGGKIEVIARNQCGEAYATTTLTCKRRKDDYRSVLRHNVKRDFINSDEYRKPEWLTKMEEIKERLAATVQAPKFIREIKEIRIKEGMRGKFEAGFAGNPKPDITWTFNGQQLQNSKSVQIKVREDSSTLTLIDCGFDVAGIYECRAVNELGSDKCRASLTVNKLTAEEKADYEKAKADGLLDLVDDEEEKVKEKKRVKEEQKEKKQKKEEKKVVKKVETKTEEKKSYDWKKNVKKVEKKEATPEPKPEKVQLKKPKMIEKVKEPVQEGPKLKPIPAKEKAEEEPKEEHKLKPVPKPKQEESTKKMAPTEAAPQKISKPKEEKIKATKDVAVQNVEGPMKAMADIRVRLEHGASVNEVNAAYEAHEFPELEKVDAQMAMIKAVERVGQSASVQEVLLQECTGKSEVDLQNVGFKALISTLAKESFKVDEVITQFQPEDFTEAVVQERLARLVTEAQDMDMADSTTTQSRVELAEGRQQAVQQETEVVKEQRKVSFQQQTVTSTTTAEVMSSATSSMQETQTLVQSESGAQQEVAVAFDVKEGDAFYALATFVSETGEAMNLVEGERVYVLEWNNADWWYVKKHLTEETGWVPAQYLKDEETYTMYVQRKLVEKIEKLPVFEKPKGNEKAFAPKITEKVKSQRSPDGAQVEFVCRVEGYPRPQITWFRQTAIIKPSPDFQIYYDENNMATLVIKEVFPEDAGTFTCVAKNCVGFASSSAELIVEHPLSDHAGGEKHDRRSLSRESSLADIVEGIPPTFAQRPSTKTADEGTNVELECRFVAIPEAEVKWFYNKKEIKTSGRVSIESQADMHMYCSFVKISKVCKEDEGTYEVIAKNREGEATNTLSLVVNMKSKKAEETKHHEVKKQEVKKVEAKKEVKAPEPAKPVAEPPVIVKPLTPTVCKVGDSVNIEAVITGKPQPKLKWYHNGKHFKSGKNVSIKENGSTYNLSISRAELKNDGDYTVKAENEAGTAQTSANICVQGEVVEFINKLDDKEVKEREVVMLEVEVTSENTEVKWHKDGEVIQDTVEKGYKFEKKGKKHSLIIEKATVHHEGEYVCSVGDQETSCEVSVVELPPEFTKSLSTVKTTAGNKAVFEIEISKGDAKTRWFKNGVEIEFNENMQLIIEGKQQRLEIYNVEVLDAGEITCTLGDKECKGALQVEEPKVNFVAKLPDNTSGTIGQDVKITVNLTASCNVKWMKEGKEIVENDKYMFECDGTTRTIIIKQATISDVAEYTCVAENVRTSTELELEGQEEKIEFQEKELKKEQTIKKGDDVTFTVPFAQTLAKKPTVQWMYKSSEIKTSEKTIITITKKFVTITIKHVESIDCGIYTCKLQNTVSQISVDFTLAMNDKPSPPRGPAQVTWKTEDTLSLQWATPETDGGAKIEEFIVERKEVGKKSWKQVGSSDKTNIEIVGLKKDASYNFRIIARNSVGCSEPFIIEETFTAAKAEIQKSLPGSPSVSVTDVTSRSVTLNWNPPNDTGGVHLIGYIIEKRLSTTEIWERVETVESSVRIFTVENLKEKSEYFFRVSAENEVGAGEAATTERVSLQTHARAPSAPTAPLEIIPVGPHALTVEWGAPESDGGAPLEGYKIAVRDAKRQMWMEVGRVAANVQKLTVKDLVEGCEYFIRIFAKNEVGFSDPLENEEPFKVVRPPDYTEESEGQLKADDAPSLSFSHTETLSSWMREASMDADIQCYTKASVLRRDEYFFRIWYYASKLFK